MTCVTNTGFCRLKRVILNLLYLPWNDLIEYNVLHPLEKYFAKSIELVWEVERYWPEIVAPPHAHSGLWNPTSPERLHSLLLCSCPKFSPVNDRVVPCAFRLGLGLSWLTGPPETQSSRPIRRQWEGAGSQGLHHSTERLWAHLGSNSDTWRGVIGRNNLSDLNLSSILLLDLWARSHVVVMPYVVQPYVLEKDGLR